MPGAREADTEIMVRRGIVGFRLTLVVYFVLLALVPLGAAFFAFGAVLRRGEESRVDTRLQTELRAVLIAYRGESDAAARGAALVARDPRFRWALAQGDAETARRVAAGVRGVVVSLARRGGRLVAEVSGSVPLGERALARLAARAGLDEKDSLLLLERGRVAVGPPGLRGSPFASLERYRSLASEPLPGRGDRAFAVVTPQASVEEAADASLQRLLLALAAALVVVGIVAYLLGRSIVGTLHQLVEGAKAIARGQLDERVPVRGRDEFAQLARAFNDMAEQLQERVAELEAERRRLRETTTRFADALGATHDEEQLRRVIVETAVEATGATRGELRAAGKTIAVGDPEAGGEVLELPLVAGAESLGVLRLTADRFASEQRELAGLLAGQAVVALENARMHAVFREQASLDPLTGLANRRRGEELLRLELGRAERLGAPLALVFADLDRFKQVNDRYGHPFGDVVLCELAGTLLGAIREIDHAARWGGEEFAIVLPGADLEGGMRLAERVRSRLEWRTIAGPGGQRVGVTASFGVAAFPDETTLEGLIAAADAALYEAKRAGRNRVARAGEPVARPSR